VSLPSASGRPGASTGLEHRDALLVIHQQWDDFVVEGRLHFGHQCNDGVDLGSDALAHGSKILRQALELLPQVFADRRLGDEFV